MNKNNDFGLPKNVDVPDNSAHEKKSKKSKGMTTFLIIIAALLLIVCVFFVCYKMMPDFQRWTDKQVEKCYTWLNSDSDTVVDGGDGIDNVDNDDNSDNTDNVEEIVPETTENQDFVQNYFVIVGTFGNFDNAKNKVKVLTDAGNTEAGILEKNGKNYVFIHSFVEEPDAEIYLSSLKSTIPDAWILKK